MADEPFSDPMECGECGSLNMKATRDDVGYQTHFECLNCGDKYTLGDEEIYGCMRVPWGFLL